VAPFKESCLHLLLYHLKALAERWFGKADALCRSGKGAFFVQGNNQFEIPDFQMGRHLPHLRAYIYLMH
jgi:hypothetical protein